MPCLDRHQKIAFLLAVALPLANAAAGANDLESACIVKKVTGKSAKKLTRAAMAEQAGAAHLIHRTDISLVPGILKSWAIIPGNQVSAAELGKAVKVKTGPWATGDFDKVFLSLWPKSDPDKDMSDWYKMGAPEPHEVIFVLDLSSLNRQDYFINPYYEYGRLADDSFKANNFTGYLKEVQQEISQSGHWPLANEVVFRHLVPLDSLREIWIDPGEAAKFSEITAPFKTLLDQHGVQIREKPTYDDPPSKIAP